MRHLTITAILFLCAHIAPVFADDTDIYLTSSSNPAAPHLMLMFDYRTDMGATFCNANGGSSCENTLAPHPDLYNAMKVIQGNPVTLGAADNITATLAVFKAVFDKFDGIYVGLMAPNKNNGGTILRGYKEFQAGDANNAKQELIDILLDIATAASNANGSQWHDVAPKETHYELWRYLNGGAVEYGDATSSNFPDPPSTGSPGHDASIISGGNYISPFSDPAIDYSCTKLYEVYATSGNAGGNDDDDLDTEIENDMSADATDANFDAMVSYLSSNDLVSDSLATGDQTMKMWFIQMGSAATRTDDWANEAGTIDQYMNVGGNNVDLIDVQTTLEAAFIEALSVSATFVSASVPVNVFNRIRTLDNFYIALFEANSTERWPGNVKKMKLVDTDLTPDGIFDDIHDASGISAFNDSDGRIKYESLTYWTNTSNLPPADPDKSEVTGKDGRSVERGGAGQKIPGLISGAVGTNTGTGTRQVYVEPASGSTFDTFDAINPTAASLQTLLGAADQTEALELISWARGIDIDDEDLDGNRTEARPWLMGDAIHSRPLALNYGATTGYSETNPNIRLFLGTNDGYFHILQNTTSSGAESGEEIFAFIPRESLHIIKKIRENTGANSHPYGVDGEPVALVNDADNDGTIESGEEVIVYVGMRRGGKSYYALDVSDPNATPTLKWKITKTSGGNFDELGYTFSTPKVVKVKYESTTRDVLIFAGGYDMQKDTPTGSGRNADSEGNAIYIVDARTGNLIWKAKDGSGTNSNTIRYVSNLDHAIPSDIATLDSNSNGIVDRAYVGDTSGIIWRIDLPEGSGADHRKDNWSIVKFADADDSSEAEDRRFFHAPDLVQSKDATGIYDGVLIASGDRASPLEDDDENELYLFKDRNTTSGSPPTSVIDEDSLPDVTSCVIGTETGCSVISHALGWKIDLDDTGEKGLASPVTAAGKVFFTSYTPAGTSACVPSEGGGQLYVVNLKDGTAAYGSTREIDIGPGIPPSVTVIGNDTLILPGTGIVDPNGDGTSSDKTKLIQAGGKPFFIIYWRESGMDSL